MVYGRRERSASKTIRRYQREIKGNTHVDVLNRKGMILVGDEIMNYEDVVQVGDPEDHTWKLSRLLRGRKNGTSREHLVGERVVFLDYGTVPFIKDVKLEKGSPTL